MFLQEDFLSTWTLYQSYLVGLVIMCCFATNKLNQTVQFFQSHTTVHNSDFSSSLPPPATSVGECDLRGNPTSDISDSINAPIRFSQDLIMATSSETFKSKGKCWGIFKGICTTTLQFIVMHI